MPALDLHGNLAGSELIGDLLVEHDGDHQTHQLALTRGEWLITGPQLGEFTR